MKNLNSFLSINITIKSLLIKSGFIFLICIISSCDKLFNSNRCPACNEKVTWKSYGKLKLSNAGYDGYFGSTNLKNDCDWRIYKGNAGGTGNIYQISSCNNGVIFSWAYGKLYSLSLSAGWEGSTEKEVSIGENLAKFLNAYPKFQPTNDSTVFNAGNVWAYFSPQKKLTQLIITLTN